MIFDKSFEVERCVSRDSARGSMPYVMLDVAAKRMIAVDGNMLASVPCEPEAADRTGLLTPEALKAARKAAGKRGTPTLVANGAQTIPGGATFPRPTEDNTGKFPPVAAVIPEYREGAEGTVTIGLNAHLLSELAKAIGDKGEVTITIKLATDKDAKHGTVDAMVVQPVYGDRSSAGPLGILMPVRHGPRGI